MNEKIISCPFCGCKGVVQPCFENGVDFVVVCEKCKSMGKTCNTPAKAITAWNTRATENKEDAKSCEKELFEILLENLVDKYFPDKLPDNLENYNEYIAVVLSTRKIKKQFNLKNTEQVANMLTEIMSLGFYLPDIDKNNEWGRNCMSTSVISSYQVSNKLTVVDFTPAFVELYRVAWLHYWQNKNENE